MVIFDLQHFYIKSEAEQDHDEQKRNFGTKTIWAKICVKIYFVNLSSKASFHSALEIRSTSNKLDAL